MSQRALDRRRPGCCSGRSVPGTLGSFSEQRSYVLSERIRSWRWWPAVPLAALCALGGYGEFSSLSRPSFQGANNQRVAQLPAADAQSTAALSARGETLRTTLQTTAILVAVL